MPSPTLKDLLAITGPIVFTGKARNLASRLAALKQLAAARLPSHQEA